MTTTDPFTTLRPRLFGIAYRMLGVRADAEDVLQDAFLQVWQRAATFDAALGSGRGWIYTVVRHQALRAVRGGLLPADRDPAAGR